jgi:hypothetical protein
VEVDSAKNPWRIMARAPDHYSLCAGEIKYLARFFAVSLSPLANTGMRAHDSMSRMV